MEFSDKVPLLCLKIQKFFLAPPPPFLFVVIQQGGGVVYLFWSVLQGIGP